jgi:hypothetical protein
MKYIISIVGREIKDSGYLLVVFPERPLHKLCFISIIEQIGERKKTVDTDRTAVVAFLLGSEFCFLTKEDLPLPKTIYWYLRWPYSFSFVIQSRTTYFNLFFFILE